MESHTKAYFSNAIAFESLHPTTKGEVSSYVAFLKGLIPSADNCCSGIWQYDSKWHRWCSCRHRTCQRHLQERDFDPSSNLCMVRDDVNEYYKGQMRKWQLRLREWWRVSRNVHLKNQCTVIAFFAGFDSLILCCRLFSVLKDSNNEDDKQNERYNIIHPTSSGITSADIHPI